MRKMIGALTVAMLVSGPSWAQTAATATRDQPASKNKADQKPTKRSELALPDEHSKAAKAAKPKRARVVELTAVNKGADDEAAEEPGADQPKEEEPTTLDTLRQQVRQQQQLIQLLEQQLATQQAQTQRLQQLNDQLEGVQQQIAQGQADEASRLAAQQDDLASIDQGVAQLRAADAALTLGDTSVNLSALQDSLPGQSRPYLEQAEQAQANGDFFTARNFIQQAISAAVQTRVQTTGLVPTPYSP